MITLWHIGCLPMKQLPSKAQALRLACRARTHTGPTPGCAPGYSQANLVVVPQQHAFDFLLFLPA